MAVVLFLGCGGATGASAPERATATPGPAAAPPPAPTDEQITELLRRHECVAYFEGDAAERLEAWAEDATIVRARLEEPDQYDYRLDPHRSRETLRDEVVPASATQADSCGPSPGTDAAEEAQCMVESAVDERGLLPRVYFDVIGISRAEGGVVARVRLELRSPLVTGASTAEYRLEPRGRRWRIVERRRWDDEVRLPFTGISLGAARALHFQALDTAVDRARANGDLPCLYQRLDEAKRGAELHDLLSQLTDEDRFPHWYRWIHATEFVGDFAEADRYRAWMHERYSEAEVQAAFWSGAGACGAGLPGNPIYDGTPAHYYECNDEDRRVLADGSAPPPGPPWCHPPAERIEAELAGLRERMVECMRRRGSASGRLKPLLEISETGRTGEPNGYVGELPQAEERECLIESLADFDIGPFRIVRDPDSEREPIWMLEAPLEW